MDKNTYNVGRALGLRGKKWRITGGSWTLTVPNITLKYSHKDKIYYCDTTGNTIDAKVVTTEDVLHYSKDQYGKIFPAYNENTDQIGWHDFEGVRSTVFYLRRDERGNKKNAVLKPGLYMVKPHEDYHDFVLEELQNTSLDKFVSLSSGTDILIKDIDDFFKSKEKFNKLSLRYRRAALLYGPAGNGKTYEIMRTVNETARNNGVIGLIISGEVTSFGRLIHLRDCLKSYNKIIIMEEITNRINAGLKVDESLLNFLDGNYSWDNCYIIATTNYPESLPKNIVDRPSRFDTLIKIGNPNEEDRRNYFKSFVGNVSESIIKQTEGYSIAYIKEIVLRSLLKDISIEECLREINKVKNLADKEFKDTQEIGFNTDRVD